MDYNEAQHVLKILELSTDLKKEIEQAKICVSDFQDGEQFDTSAYLDKLFGAKYNELEDADIDEDSENIEIFLSGCSTKDLVISLIISLCVSHTLSICDVVTALDKLKQVEK